MNWVILSKMVGWEPREIEYPSAIETESLLNRAEEYHSMYKLLEYYRFLHSPETKEQHDRINRITNAVNQIRKDLE